MKKYIKCHVKIRTNKEKLNAPLCWSDLPEFKGRRWISGNEFWGTVYSWLGIPYVPTRKDDIQGFDLTLPPFSKGS